MSQLRDTAVHTQSVRGSGPLAYCCQCVSPVVRRWKVTSHSLVPVIMGRLGGAERKPSPY